MKIVATQNSQLSKLKVAARDQDYASVIQLLRNLVSISDNTHLQSIYGRIAAAVGAKDESLVKLKVTFLGGYTLDHWVDSIRLWLLLDGFGLDPQISQLNTWQQQILESDSELYSFQPEIVWLFLRPEDFLLQQDKCVGGCEDFDFVNKAVDDLLHKISLLQSKLNSFIVVNNFASTNARVLGNYEGSTAKSYAMAIHTFNLNLAKRLPGGVTIFDVAHISAQVGLRNWEDSRLWYHSKHPFSFNVNGEVAFAASRLISALKGRSKKCIVVDLDNTLWGGVIGDEGVDGIKVGPDGGAIGEAYSAFQIWLKAMSRRGIALAVCSKNDLDIAKEPFLKKSGMALDLDDFVVFKANWSNKADNLRAIAAELNIGLDSIVFIDDNPVERDLIRRELPQVAVPEMPNDPADFIEVICMGRWFETVALSKEDFLRVEAYRQNISRREEECLSADLDTFLSDLNMGAIWSAVDSRSLQRAAQLINKTNQFQLTQSRYTEAEVKTKAASSAYWVGNFSLVDKFGDHGIISVVILRFENQSCFIDTWVMSCRVFSRTMEQFIFNVILDICEERGMTEIIGIYKESAKNKIVSELYVSFGGEERDSLMGNEKHYVFYPKLKSLSQKTFIRDMTKATIISSDL